MKTKNLENGKNNIFAQRASRLIPGGAHTYSKGDDQFPINAPKIIDKGLGCTLWDVDGNEFTDLGTHLARLFLAMLMNQF